MNVINYLDLFNKLSQVRKASDIQLRVINGLNIWRLNSLNKYKGI